MLDEADLLRAWREGDADAGRTLFERHFESIFRFFRNKASDDLEDLVQSTFASCLASREQIRGEASFRTYLFTIARHELYAHWRRRRRDAATVDIGSLSVEDLAPSPGTLLDARDERERLAHALRTLPLDLQIAVELHYWEELSGSELARALEIPEGTVRSRLRRAREALAAALATSPDAIPPDATLEARLSALKEL